jgi:hypothetical protein
MQQPDFWRRPDRFDVLARYALMDRVKAALGTARGLEARVDRSKGRDGRYSRDLVSRLASALYLVQHGMEDVRLNAAIEVVLSVQPVLDAAPDPAASQQWAERLLDMYRRWASRRHMQWDELSATAASAPLVVVSGFGAARILQREAGLHVLEYADAAETSARAAARVRVAPTPSTLPEAATAKHAALLAELAKPGASIAVVRRYRLDASPLVRDVVQGWRTGRQDLVLNGDFDLLADVLSAAT